MKLSNRLEMVISTVLPQEAAADVGTDHGHVPVELVRRGIVRRGIAMDIRKGPLSRAKENIAAAGLKAQIETRLSDGVKELKPGEAQTLIIAGMGGELVIHILEDGRHMWDTVEQWVLSPHSETDKVRKWLCEHEFPIAAEHMVSEDGKYYTILDVRRRGTMPVREIPPKRFAYGTCLIEKKNPVFLNYLKEEERKLESLQAVLREQAEHSERAAESLAETEEKLFLNREVQNEMQ